MTQAPHPSAQPSTLVTGGTGLLGAYVLRELLQHGHLVKALHRDRMPLLLTKEETDRIVWIKGDVLDPSLLAEAMEGVDQVYHCAGVVSFNPAKKDHMMKINVEGTANVVNAAIESGVRKLCHVSSVSALGRKRDNATINEASKWSEEVNLSNYGESKHYAEMEVWRGISEGLSAVIVNPTIILGFGDWDTGSGATFRNAWEEFPWYTDGTSGFVDAADVASVMRLLMDSEISGERYVVSAENLPFRELFTRMAKAFGKKPPHRKVNPLLAGVVWRWEWLKSRVSGTDPLLTKETADTARRTVFFDNSKLLKALPGFKFKGIADSVTEHCREYSVKTARHPQ
jgi:dihydroflavonol-4-reductase